MQTLHISSPWSPNPQHPHHTVPTSLSLQQFVCLGWKISSQPNWTRQLQPNLLEILCTLVLLVSVHNPSAMFSKTPYLSTVLFSSAHRHPIYIFLSGSSGWEFWDRDHLFISVPRAARFRFAYRLLTDCSYKNNCNYNISYKCSEMDFCHISTKLFSETWNSIEES